MVKERQKEGRKRTGQELVKDMTGPTGHSGIKHQVCFIDVSVNSLDTKESVVQTIHEEGELVGHWRGKCGRMV